MEKGFKLSSDSFPKQNVDMKMNHNALEEEEKQRGRVLLRLQRHPFMTYLIAEVGVILTLYGAAVLLFDQQKNKKMQWDNDRPKYEDMSSFEVSLMEENIQLEEEIQSFKENVQRIEEIQTIKKEIQRIEEKIEAMEENIQRTEDELTIYITMVDIDSIEFRIMCLSEQPRIKLYQSIIDNRAQEIIKEDVKGIEKKIPILKARLYDLIEQKENDKLSKPRGSKEMEPHKSANGPIRDSKVLDDMNPNRRQLELMRLYAMKEIVIDGSTVQITPFVGAKHKK